MASLNIDFRRPCHVKGKRAMFHCWSHMGYIQPPFREDKKYKGLVSATYGIIEYENGRVERVEPESVIFVDHGGFNEYYFE